MRAPLAATEKAANQHGEWASMKLARKGNKPPFASQQR